MCEGDGGAVCEGDGEQCVREMVSSVGGRW